MNSTAAIHRGVIIEIRDEGTYAVHTCPQSMQCVAVVDVDGTLMSAELRCNRSVGDYVELYVYRSGRVWVRCWH